MECAEVVEVITEYLEGAMDPRDRRRFDAHLAECEYCQNYLDQMRATVAALGELREDAIAPGDRQALVDAFRGWRERRV
jgi:anti-sigma factor RsiW